MTKEKLELIFDKNKLMKDDEKKILLENAISALLKFKLITV
jgi:hypothetical protein